jgi:hypothetical protein
VVIAQGHRNRELAVTLAHVVVAAPQRTAAVPSPRLDLGVRAGASWTRTRTSTSTSATPYLLGATALLGAGSYLVLWNWARQDNQALSRCTPNCPAAAVSHVQKLYLAADISLGIAAAAALSTVAWFAFSGSGSSDQAPPLPRYALSVQPARTGALATLRGAL